MEFGQVSLSGLSVHYACILSFWAPKHHHNRNTTASATYLYFVPPTTVYIVVLLCSLTSKEPIHPRPLYIEHANTALVFVTLDVYYSIDSTSFAVALHVLPAVLLDVIYLPRR